MYEDDTFGRWMDELHPDLWNLVIWINAMDREMGQACRVVLERRYPNPPAAECGPPPIIRFPWSRAA